MQKHLTYFWKQAPFVRLLVPFILGIMLQWYLQLPLNSIYLLTILAALVFISFSFTKDHIKFFYGWTQGIAQQCLFFAIGCLVTYQNDISKHDKWLGHHYKSGISILATIKEPLVEKSNSYKASASVDAVKVNGYWKNVSGKILIYFKKDDDHPKLAYGTQIILAKPLQPIKNSGNPGGFDYERYCKFQDIYHQVFLTHKDYLLTGNQIINPIWSWLYNMRLSVINTLKQYIHPKREAGVAEALLIGYRDDLDKDLVQAYSNTGVVHIIAISGLHLGLIYGMLIAFFQPLNKRKWVRWVKPATILIVIWIFTLLAGAAPSILRSAVMFSALILGDLIDRKTSVYNNLAASAFIMLCYNPFFLWDVGFQLSYAALVSIVTFRDPIYKLIYLQNKALDSFWRLNAVTISAQILTLPFILYYFHQFPNLFLITNFVAVPLSGFILYAELGLLVISHFPPIATWVGNICSGMIWALNSFVQAIDTFPFAVTDGIQISLFQALLITSLLLSTSYWFINKSKGARNITFVHLTILAIAISMDTYFKKQQQKLIVYNIPKQSLIEFIDEDKYQSIGDTAVLNDAFTQNFHLKPARTFYGVRPAQLQGFYYTYPFTLFKNKRILLLDKPLKFTAPQKLTVDLIVISKNPKIYITQLVKTFNCKQIVFDASNPQWKINLWKKDCDSLHLRHHSTAEKGAFVMDL